VLEAGGAICDPAGACVCVYVLRVCACGVCWDVAAGALIVLEAGGAISDPAGACVCVYVLRVCACGGCSAYLKTRYCVITLKITVHFCTGKELLSAPASCVLFFLF